MLSQLIIGDQEQYLSVISNRKEYNQQKNERSNNIKQMFRFFIFFIQLLICILCIHPPMRVLRITKYEFKRDHTDPYYSQVEKSMEKLSNSTSQQRVVAENIESQPLRITLSFEKQEDQELPQEIQNYTQKVLNTAFNYFEQLIKIKRSSENNTFVLKELKNCLGIEIKENYYETGVENSDLHIFASFSTNNSSLIASAGHCYVDTTLKRPTYGRILLNLAHFSKADRTNIQFNRDLQTLMHEILHILGFSPAAMNYWIDPDTNKPYTYRNIDKIVTSHWFQDKETTIISSKNILKAAREYYNCSSIEGMQLEDEGGDLTRGQHWERSILMNEMMTGSATPGGGVFSIFTVALLRDTGFWDVVDENLSGKLFWGKNKGCDFFENRCVADLKYDEFENTEGEIGCSFTGEGFGLSQSDPYSDGCNLIYPTDDTLCINYEHMNSNQYNQTQSINLIQSYSTQSRCFKSSVSVDDSRNEHIKLRCHRAECSDDNKEISIHLDSINMTLKCTEPGQSIDVDDGFKTYGQIDCPKNFPLFCASLTNICPNFCSSNGYCVEGKCHCNAGYSGNDCSQICEQKNEDGTCVISCDKDTYSNPDGTCQKTCPKGYYMNELNNSCSRCHHTCSQCKGPSHQECLACHFLSYLHNSQCVEECENGYFQNKEQRICSRCVEGCISCTASYQCEFCDTENCYALEENLCRNTKCNSSCFTCQWDQNDKCTTCASGTFLNKETRSCVEKDQCPKGSYGDSSQKECLPCAEGCSTCIERNNKCQSCDESKGYLLFGEECFVSQSCLSPCESCLDPSSPNSCSSCVSGYLFQDSECVVECSIGFFQQENQCIKCSENCEDCDGEADICLSCTEEKFLHESKCISKCLEGQTWEDGACSDVPIAANTFINMSYIGNLQFLYLSFIALSLLI